MKHHPRLMELGLTDAERDRLGSRLLGSTYPQGDDYEAFIHHSEAVVREELPRRLLDEIDALRTTRAPAGAVVLRNLPADPHLPPTPADGLRSPDKDTAVSEALLLGVARLLGEPYSFTVEKGTLVHDVAPVRQAVEELTNRGAGTLGLHTELAAFEHRPRWLLLKGLRPDHERRATTPVADARDALALLERGTIEALYQPDFRTRMPFIFDPLFEGEARYSQPHAVLSGPEDCPELRAALYGGLTRGLTAETQAALGALERALQQVARPVFLDRGVLVILSNHLVTHGRSAYQPRFDGTDRWFQRVNVADSLWPLRDWQGRSVRLLGG